MFVYNNVHSILIINFKPESSFSIFYQIKNKK